MGKWLKNKKGLTLIEILVSLAILGIIIAPVSSMFLTTIKANQRAKSILLANQLAQQYMEKLKASPNPMNEPIPPVDTATGFVLLTEVTKYKDEEFKLPSGGSSGSSPYVSIVDIFERDGSNIFVYDGEGNFGGKLNIKQSNGMNNIDLDIYSDRLVFSNKNKKGNNIVIPFDASEINIKIMYEGNIKIHIFVDHIDVIPVNFYLNKESMLKHFDIKSKKNRPVSIYPQYLPENPSEVSNILYKITVTVKDKTGVEELAKLAGLKKVQ